MKNTIFTPLKSIILLSFAICSSSCALSSITSDYNFENSNMQEVSLAKLGDGKVLVYNDVNFMHTLDNTGRVNVWIDDKPAGQIRASEYIIYTLSPGKHQIRLLHVDVVNIRSSHEISVENATKVVKIKATSVSKSISFKTKFSNCELHSLY